MEGAGEGEGVRKALQSCTDALADYKVIQDTYTVLHYTTTS